jgi:DNA mismatch repair protein MutS2
LQNRFLAAVTTHYTDLKVFAHVTPGLENASFDFDPHTLTPTYHLTVGIPGGSNAIATAAHFGLPEDVVVQARASLSQENQQMEDLLISLNSEKQHLIDVNKELDREKNTYLKQNAALTTELKKLRDEKQAMLRAARDDVVAEIALLQKEINAASAELKRQTSRSSVDAARESSKRVRERLKTGPGARTTEQIIPEEGDISIGDYVWLKEYDVKGTVTALNAESGQVEVNSGALRFRVARDDVSRVSGAQTLSSQAVKLHAAPRSVPMELVLRGKRADEVEPLLDAYLSDAAVARLPWVRIIHGFGTGVVRSIVRDIAGRHVLAKSFRSAEPSEGGDGATIINLK